MNEQEQRKGAIAFAKRWKGIGNEEQDKQNYWKELLKEIYGIERYNYLKFEKPVDVVIPVSVEEAREGKKAKKSKKFIDVYLPSVHVLIEQKGVKYNLDLPEQRGELKLTPLEQAKLYNSALLHHERARWIITCNFQTIRVYDTAKSLIDIETEIQLEELPDRFHELDFLIDESIQQIRKEEKVSAKAGALVGELYDALLETYTDPDSKETKHGLNVLMVRLVFLLYAEDAGLLQSHTAFGDFCKSYKPENLRSGLKELFRILDQDYDERDEDEPDKLTAFPYINGGLFNDQTIKLPKTFSQKAYDILIDKMSYDTNWTEISPTIFGMVFESTLDSKMRREGGMHYTSLENIHKILDNLFLNDLRDELDEIKGIKTKRTDGRRITQSINTKIEKLNSFRKKLSKIEILDPAAGSGNFLTESYLSLRKLENEALEELYKGERVLGDSDPIQVKISQMHGIEINDFAVAVAKTALWIAESQMYEETKVKIGAENVNISFLPLHSNSDIIEGNALRLNWSEIASKNTLTYIIGNPPFLGYSQQNKEQKADIQSVYVDETGKSYKRSGKIDYVSAWYFKAAEFIYDTEIRVAFVSTNSISQGEQVSTVWEPLYKRFGIHIDFVFKTFEWESQSTNTAAVHVIIISFSSAPYNKQRKIYENTNVTNVNSISPYLKDEALFFLESRSKPICNVLPMITGNRPADGGALIIEEEDYQEFISKEPKSKKYIKKLTGSEEYINNKNRYCLWLVDATPSELRSMPLVMERVNLCKQNRKNGAADRQKLANTPTLFRETMNPESYIIVPATSSKNRKYIPIGFLNKDTIPTNAAVIIKNASLYDFGILESNIHMAWMRATAGRLKSDYRYSKDIVYNNFPWPTPTKKQKQMIEKTAKAILETRAKYPESSLADLYDENTMPPELRKAHEENDKAVIAAYKFKKDITEEEIVIKLFKMYEDLTTQ